MSRVKLTEITSVPTGLDYVGIQYSRHVSHYLIFKSQCRQSLAPSQVSVSQPLEPSPIRTWSREGPLLRTQATGRSIKNIVFNLARRVSRAYTRFHNHTYPHVYTRLRSCVRARCRFHDAGCQPPFPRQFDKLVGEDFTSRESTYRLSSPRELTNAFTPCLPAALFPLTLPCKSLFEESVFPREFQRSCSRFVERTKRRLRYASLIRSIHLFTSK